MTIPQVSERRRALRYDLGGQTETVTTPYPFAFAATREIAFTRGAVRKLVETGFRACPALSPKPAGQIACLPPVAWRLGMRVGLMANSPTRETGVH